MAPDFVAASEQAITPCTSPHLSSEATDPLAAAQLQAPSEQTRHQGSHSTEQLICFASEALAETADQPLGFGQIASGLPASDHHRTPHYDTVAGTAVSTAPSSPGEAAGSTVRLNASAKSPPPAASGSLVQLLQDSQEFNANQQAAAELPPSSASPAAKPSVKYQSLWLQLQHPAGQQHQPQQTQAEGEQRATAAEQDLLSPAQGLQARLAYPPASSPTPSRRRCHHQQSHRHHKSHSRKKAKLDSAAGKQPARAYWQWHTLGDVFQDLNVNDVIFTGRPMHNGQPIQAGPATPAFQPEQYVDTRPLAYLHLLLQQENQPASMPHHIQTSYLHHSAAEAANQGQSPFVPWEPSTQLRQHNQAQATPQFTPQPACPSTLDLGQHMQTPHLHTDRSNAAAPSTQPAPLLRRPTSLHGSAPVAVQPRLTAAASPVEDMHQIPSDQTACSAESSPIPEPAQTSPVRNKSKPDNGSNSSILPPAPLHSPSHSLERALDRLFSSRAQVHRSSAGSLPGPLQQCSSSRHPTLPPVVVGSPSERRLTHRATSDSLHTHRQPSPPPTCTCLHPQLQPTASILPRTSAAYGAGTMHIIMPSPQLPMCWPQPGPPEPQLQVHGVFQADILQAEPSHLQGYHTGSMQSLPVQPMPSPQLHAAWPAPLGHCSASAAASQQHPSASLPAIFAAPQEDSKSSKQQQLTSTGPELVSDAAAGRNDSLPQCISGSPPSPPAGSSPETCEPLPCSPERASSPPATICPPPVVLWNSPDSRTSLPMLQQATESPPSGTTRSLHHQLSQTLQSQIDASPFDARQLSSSQITATASPGRPSPDSTAVQGLDGISQSGLESLPDESARQAGAMQPSSAAVQLASKRWPHDRRCALEDIAYSAKCLLSSLDLASSPPIAGCTAMHERVRPH